MRLRWRRGSAGWGSAHAGRELLEGGGGGAPARLAPGRVIVNELLDLNADGLDADAHLAPKTRFDYRRNADAYVRPWLGHRKVRNLGPDVVLAWQRDFTKTGAAKSGGPLAANTVRLARASLGGAVKLAVVRGLLRVNPLPSVPRPNPDRKVPRYWTQGRPKPETDGLVRDALLAWVAVTLALPVREMYAHGTNPDDGQGEGGRERPTRPGRRQRLRGHRRVEELHRRCRASRSGHCAGS